jgi:hypothetical protein
VISQGPNCASSVSPASHGHRLDGCFGSLSILSIFRLLANTFFQETEGDEKRVKSFFDNGGICSV